MRTGKRANTLQILMSQAGYRSVSVGPPPPRLDILPQDGCEQVIGLFESLGGRAPLPPLRPGAWDLAFADGLVVELDEELHFNRYRARSLQFPWATELPWHRAYLDLCRRREQECLAAGRWGTRWTNPSCESMFGSPATPGSLEGPGAPRWKQRALYDAFEDIAALHSNDVRLCRVSVWDNVGGATLGGALAGVAIEPGQIGDLIDRRTR